MSFGNLLYDDIDNNEYLNELYDTILYNYSISLLGVESEKREYSIEAALRFADILSKSTHETKSEQHKIWGQEIVALIKEIEPDNPIVEHYLCSVLSTTGNYRGLLVKGLDCSNQSLLDMAYTEFSKDLLSVPADRSKHFFRSQKQIYNRFNDDYFSFSGPTSMGKSFVMRMFIKEQVMLDSEKNFAIIVPTKALINEVSSNVINELKELLAEKNYRVVTSAGALALEQQHNFIFVLTPERLLYLLIRHGRIKVDYLFIDEAHKISAKDGRSAFYYKVVDMLIQRPNKPNVIFASPNIPNPDVFLGLIPNIEKENRKLLSYYSPVSQIKYFVDFVDNEVKFYNEHKHELQEIESTIAGGFIETLKLFFQREMNTIVYINSKDKAMQYAKDFANDLPALSEKPFYKDLKVLSNEIKSLIHKDFFLADMVLKGVAFHIGYLPTSIRIRLEELYRERKIKIMFCTSTLIEGVNLPADNLFVTTFYRGNSKLSPVDFRNLIGRVGRIEYNLYGNVFLARIEERTNEKGFVDLLKQEVPEQTLSLVSELTDEHKALIVNTLLTGDVEIPKDNLEKVDYELVRKFTLILLRDIMKNRKSIVRKAFDEFLTEEIEATIKEHFEKPEVKPDDDINASVDQTNRLLTAIKEGLEYPKVNSDGDAKHDEILAFLEKLHDIFKWDKYESGDIGKKTSLQYYALMLNQWIGGNGLNFITFSAINYAQNSMNKAKRKQVYVNGRTIPYNDSPLHRNIVIGETLQSIETIILFKFSNYFLKFSECYKKEKKLDVMLNDWYEYVEYGTSNALSILLQRNGFSRDTALYIKQNANDFVVIVSGVYKLKKTLLDNAKESIKKEIQELIFNAPELFVEEAE